MATKRSFEFWKANYDRRSELVKDVVAKQNAALDEKTARLRALRLADVLEKNSGQ